MIYPNLKLGLALPVMGHLSLMKAAEWYIYVCVCMYICVYSYVWSCDGSTLKSAICYVWYVWLVTGSGTSVADENVRRARQREREEEERGVGGKA